MALVKVVSARIDAGSKLILPSEAGSSQHLYVPEGITSMMLTMPDVSSHFGTATVEFRYKVSCDESAWYYHNRGRSIGWGLINDNITSGGCWNLNVPSGTKWFRGQFWDATTAAIDYGDIAYVMMFGPYTKTFNAMRSYVRAVV